MDTIVGKCSNCGGDVVLPSVWYGTVQPVPTCNKCGATKANDRPVVKMDPPPRRELPTPLD